MLRLARLLVVVSLAVSNASGQAAGGDAVARYQKLLREPESSRVALAADLAAVPGARAANLLKAELQNAKGKALLLALLGGLRAHPRPELAVTVADVLRPSAPDADLAKAVGAALAGLGDPGVPHLQDLVTTFGTGRSNHRERPATHAALVAALGGLDTPRARAATAALASKGNPLDRQRLLATLAQADGAHGVQQARRAALDAPTASLVLEGLRQLAAHDDPTLVESVLAVANRATGALAPPLLAGIAPIAAEKLRPELYGVFLTAAAATDPTLGQSLRRFAAKLRADVELGRFVLARAGSLRDASERTLAVHLLRTTPGAQVTAYLVESTQAKEPVVSDAAVAALGERGEPEAIPGLRKLLRSPGADRRRGAFLALHGILRRDPAWRDEVRNAIEDADLQVLAIDLLADLGDEDFLPVAQSRFTASDWRVRAAAYDFCRRVRAVSSVPLLLDRLAVEKDRMRQDVIDALTALTGQTLQTEMQWRHFWQDHAPGFQLPPAGAQVARGRRSSDDSSATRTYYSLPVVSTAVCFVVDHSGSMAAPVGTGGSTRLEEAKRQIVRVLGSTPDGYRVNVIAFDTQVQPLLERMVELDDRSRRDLIARVQAVRIGSATNVHDGLAQAFADPDVDTIYLLTDGAPSAGPIVDANGLREAVARWNRNRRIRIHTIAVGMDSQLMKWLAADSGGQTVTVR
ncbi:MAG: HEAT repeat domain-containing protein [Planctomycetota bacterium]